MRIYCLLIAVSLVLTSCTLGPDFTRPQLPVGNTYTTNDAGKALAINSRSSGTAQTLLIGKDISGQWWTLFHSPALTALIDKAIINSPDLQAALAVLTRTEELADAKQSSLLPSADAQIASTRQKVSGAMFGNPGAGGYLFNLYHASVNVSYTLDVFGSIRRQIEGLEAQTELARFQLEAAFLTLAGNIVTTVVEEASLRAQLTATSDILKNQTEQLRVIQGQLAVGAASKLDFLAQQTTVAQTQATIPPLQQQLEQQQHRLAVLVGETPSYQFSSRFSLKDLQLPTQLPISVPSKLLNQRPDIRAKEALLHEATAYIGVATAALFPDFTVTANIGSIATHLGDFMVPGSTIWNTGLNLLQPVFHGGEAWHKRRAAIAMLTEAQADYRRTVLLALQNVADTLSALALDAAELTAQNVARQAAYDSLELTRAQYNAGAVSYVALLSAQSFYAQSQLGQIKAQAARYADTAALFQALGGGWWNRQALFTQVYSK